MNTISSAPKQRKHELTIEFLPAEPGAPIFVSITQAGRQSDYWFERIPADFGVGVRVRKIWDGKARDFAFEQYDVNLDLTSWLHTCECLGALRWGRCKHIDAAVKLWDAGLLLPVPRPEHARERPAKQQPIPSPVEFQDP
jgi:hypothetical protein